MERRHYLSKETGTLERPFADCSKFQRFRVRVTTTMAPVKATGAVFAALSIAILSYLLCNSRSRKTHKPISKKKPRRGLIEAIGNTPLIRINSLSEATGCEVILIFIASSFHPFLIL